MARAKALRFGGPQQPVEPAPVQEIPVSTKAEQAPIVNTTPEADPRGEQYVVGGTTVWRRKRKS